MRKICIINQKGGVGKTTTAVTLAKGFADAGRRVLVVDLDPQGNVSNCLATKPGKDIYNFLVEGVPVEHCLQCVDENLWVLPSKETLTKAEMILAGEPFRETMLKRKLAALKGWDYILLDCPPSLGLLNQNALLYADEAIIPTSTDVLGLDALNKMVEAIDTVNDVFGHHLAVTAIVPTMFDARLKICREMLNELQSAYYEKVTSPIRINSKLREAPKKRQAIFQYDKRSRGAKDYRFVVDFLLDQEHGRLHEATPLVSVSSRA